MAICLLGGASLLSASSFVRFLSRMTSVGSHSSLAASSSSSAQYSRISLVSSESLEVSRTAWSRYLRTCVFPHLSSRSHCSLQQSATSQSFVSNHFLISSQSTSSVFMASSCLFLGLLRHTLDTNHCTHMSEALAV